MSAEPTCDVCAGTGQPVSGKPCICGGSGYSHHEKIGLRRKVRELELRNREIGDALVRLQTALSDDVKSTGPFKIDLHKVSRNLKDAMMYAVTIIQANGLVEKRNDVAPALNSGGPLCPRCGRVAGNCCPDPDDDNL